MDLNVLTILNALYLIIFNQKDLRKEMESGSALNVMLGNTSVKVINVMKAINATLVMKIQMRIAETVESLMEIYNVSTVLLDMLLVMMDTAKFQRLKVVRQLMIEIHENVLNACLSSVLILPEQPVFLATSLIYQMDVSLVLLTNTI